MSTEVFSGKISQGGSRVEEDWKTGVGGVIEEVGKWWRAKAVLGSPQPLTRKEDGKAGGFAGFLSEQTRNGAFVLARGVNAVESGMMRKNGMKGVGPCQRRKR